MSSKAKVEKCYLPPEDTRKDTETKACCTKFFGKCTPALEKKLGTPLELTFPELYGDLDEEQLDIIAHGGNSLVLVENAADVIRQMKNVHGFLENIMETLLKETKSDYKFLGSYTFPAILKKNALAKWKTNKNLTNGMHGEDAKLTKQYDREVGKVLNAIKHKDASTNAVLHMSINISTVSEVNGKDIESDVGHYAVAIKTGKNLTIFDSMQYNGASPYSGLFWQIARDVFNMSGKVLNSPKTKAKCPQVTGGFVEGKRPKETKEEFLTRLQDMDSQNHFCYMWAIWYFHIFLLRGQKGVEKIFDEIAKDCIPPLAVIKRYIWSWVLKLYPGKVLEDLISVAIDDDREQKPTKAQVDFVTKFFLIHFRYVWDNMDGNTPFNLYAIADCDREKFVTFSADDCLNYSLEIIPYFLVKSF